MLGRILRKYGYRLRSIWTMLAGFDRPLQTLAIFTGRASEGTSVLGVRGTPHRFEVRGAMDTWCVKEALLDRLYERFGFTIEPRWTVMDIGAGIGEFAIAAAGSATQGRVLAFEPFAPSFRLLERNVVLNRIVNIEVFNEAVTGQTRSLGLDVSSGEPAMFESVDLITGEGNDRVPIVSAALGDIVRRLGIDRLDLLKLDCEGAEYDILLNSPPDVIEQVQRIVMEYHDQTTDHTHVDLEQFLVGAGFEVEAFPNPVHPDQIGYLRASRTHLGPANE